MLIFFRHRKSLNKLIVDNFLRKELYLSEYKAYNLGKISRPSPPSWKFYIHNASQSQCAHRPHCSRSSLRFARPEPNDVLSNLFETSTEGKAGENQGDNQKMNHNGCNCRRLAFLSDFDWKPNRVNDNERVIVFRVQGPPENKARLSRIKPSSLS